MNLACQNKKVASSNQIGYINEDNFSNHYQLQTEISSEILTGDPAFSFDPVQYTTVYNFSYADAVRGHTHRVTPPPQQVQAPAPQVQAPTPALAQTPAPQVQAPQVQASQVPTPTTVLGVQEHQKHQRKRSKCQYQRCRA
jgi:hypothetical protein